MKLINKISIIVAGSILLMHSILPHEHHSELDEEQHVVAHETATSLLDFIKLAFHVDLGEDHLERYKITQQEHLAFDLIIPSTLNPSFEVVRTEITSQKSSLFQEKLHSRHLSRYLRLRGPPQEV